MIMKLQEIHHLQCGPLVSGLARSFIFPLVMWMMKFLISNTGVFLFFIILTGRMVMSLTMMVVLIYMTGTSQQIMLNHLFTFAEENIWHNRFLKKPKIPNQIIGIFMEVQDWNCTLKRQIH